MQHTIKIQILIIFPYLLTECYFYTFANPQRPKQLFLKFTQQHNNNKKYFNLINVSKELDFVIKIKQMERIKCPRYL